LDFVNFGGFHGFRFLDPPWSGFCAAADIGKLNRFLNRCRKSYRFQQLNQDIYSVRLINLYISANKQSTCPPSAL